MYPVQDQRGSVAIYHELECGSVESRCDFRSSGRALATTNYPVWMATPLACSIHSHVSSLGSTGPDVLGDSGMRSAAGASTVEAFRADYQGTHTPSAADPITLPCTSRAPSRTSRRVHASDPPGRFLGCSGAKLECMRLVVCWVDVKSLQESEGATHHSIYPPTRAILRPNSLSRSSHFFPTSPRLHPSTRKAHALSVGGNKLHALRSGRKNCGRDFIRIRLEKLREGLHFPGCGFAYAAAVSECLILSACSVW